MEFRLRLEKPANELSGFTSHNAVLTWEARQKPHEERFWKRSHVELMRAVFMFLRSKGYAIEAIDVSEMGRLNEIVFHTTPLAAAPTTARD